MLNTHDRVSHVSSNLQEIIPTYMRSNNTVLTMHDKHHDSRPTGASTYLLVAHLAWTLAWTGLGALQVLNYMSHHSLLANNGGRVLVPYVHPVQITSSVLAEGFQLLTEVSLLALMSRSLCP